VLIKHHILVNVGVTTSLALPYAGKMYNSTIIILFESLKYLNYSFIGLHFLVVCGEWSSDTLLWNPHLWYSYVRAIWDKKSEIRNW